MTNQSQANKSRKPTKSPKINVRTLTLSAMLMASSVVIGILCKNFFTFGIYYRITFENLPILLCGMLFGPVMGMLAGAGADIISCLCSTNPNVNPVITLGAMTVGLLAGLCFRMIPKTHPRLRLIAAVAISHLIGQVAIKSVAKILFFGMPFFGCFIGLGISAVVGTLEALAIRLLLQKRIFANYTDTLSAERKQEP